MVERKAASIVREFRARAARGEGVTLRQVAEKAIRERDTGAPRRTGGEGVVTRPPTVAPTPTPVGEPQLKTRGVTISGRVVGKISMPVTRVGVTPVRQEVIAEQIRTVPISTITAAPPPRGFLERQLRRVRIKQFGIMGKPGKEFAIGIPLGIAEVGIGVARFGKAFFKQPVITTGAAAVGLKEFGKKIITGAGFPEAGRVLIQQPGRAVGLVAGELLLFKGTGKAISVSGRAVRVGVTKISPKFRPIEITTLGEQIITGKTPVGLIPKGEIPKVPVKPLEAVRIAKIPIIAKPTIPKLTAEQRTILGVARERGGIVTGSLAEATLFKPRPFADIDVLLRRPKPVAAEVVKRIGRGAKVKEVTIKTPTGRFDIYRVVRGRKVIADIEPLKFGEEGFARRFPTITVEGVKFISPEARLAAKVAQFGRGKRSPKVLRDIERLTGGKLKAFEAAKSPLVRGAFGFTKAEQARFIGKRGTIATSARDLFKPFRSTVKIEEPLFFTPPSPKGLPQTRISRLAIEGRREAKLIDILTGDITFRRPKPHIALVPKITVGKEVKPFGLAGPVSTELEVVRLGGKIKKVKTIGVTLIEGERVPIITAKFIEGKKPIALPKGLEAKITKPTSLKKLSEGVISKEVKLRPFVSPTGVTTKGLLAIGKAPRLPSVAPRITPRVKISIPVSRRIRTKPSRVPVSIPIRRRPSRLPSRPPIKIPSRPSSIPPSRPPSVPPSRPPSVPPSIPPSRPPSVPPSRPPIIPPRIIIPPPPRIPGLDLPKKILKPKKKLKKLKAFRPTRFQPSLGAIVPKKKIFGKIPDVLTGIELRPIPIERMLR
ncbi:hypothetical protein LCGC14_1380710 [marine sediment metagenome]|uniref:Uncharacterized protein n=1 Tax=marine sediment metagenome TaxID=412755 RepID=A0A0F9K2U9_9ZZZZ